MITQLRPAMWIALILCGLHALIVGPILLSTNAQGTCVYLTLAAIIEAALIATLWITKP